MDYRGLQKFRPLNAGGDTAARRPCLAAANLTSVKPLHPAPCSFAIFPPHCPFDEKEIVSR
jgi:hypothetical protein